MQKKRLKSLVSWPKIHKKWANFPFFHYFSCFRYSSLCSGQKWLIPSFLNTSRYFSCSLRHAFQNRKWHHNSWFFVLGYSPPNTSPYIIHIKYHFFRAKMYRFLKELCKPNLLHLKDLSVYIIIIGGSGNLRVVTQNNSIQISIP